MSSVDQSKRSFLKGRIRSGLVAVRPPWAVDRFLELCNRCHACIDQCEERILFKGDGGYPQVSFKSGGCNWCEACVAACETSALDYQQTPPWKLKASVTQRCLSSAGVICRSCADACVENAIYFNIQNGVVATPSINDDLCDGCGFCFSVCPENAIEIRGAS